MRNRLLSMDCRNASDTSVHSLEALLLMLALVLSRPAFGADDASHAPAADVQKLNATGTASTATPTSASGLVMLDYQAIKINGNQAIDLLGVHFLNKFSDWLYVGIGGHAPLFKGDYGGFMAFDVTLHAQRRLFGNVSAALGTSFGGGGGGKNTEQSKILSGSGGFTKNYIGLDYNFGALSAGINYSKIKFRNSIINNSQLGLYIQAPFSYSVAPYEQSGLRIPSNGALDLNKNSTPSDKDELAFGLDNLIQINPKGSKKNTVNLADVQYNHFLTDNCYVLFGGSVGYHGITGYNQAFGGLGCKNSLSRHLSVNFQLALGSGGYAPDKIDTGSGLLIYPKLSAEYRFDNNISLALSTGYLYAPRGSSRNLTLGGSLVYHFSPNVGGSLGEQTAATENEYRGQRVHAFLQTQFKVKVGDQQQDKLKLLTVQIDTVLRDHIYVPLQGSIAYDSYLGYPGYGEVLVGLGVQNKYSSHDAVQTFAQLLIGTNIHGLIAKPAVGVNFGLNDRLAIYGQLGGTVSLDSVGLYPKQYKFRSTSVGLGMSYRFSVPP